MRIDALAHGVFQRERLDGADALQGFLHRLQNVGGAGELGIGQPLDPLHQFSQHEERGRRDEPCEQRHIGVLIDHQSDQRDQRQQIAADRGDEQVEDLRHGGSALRQPVQKFRRVPVGKEADALIHQPRKHVALIAGDDGVGDLRQDDGVTVGRRALDHEQHHDHQRHRYDGLHVAVDIGLVDHLAQKPWQYGGDARRDDHQNGREHVAPPVNRGLLAQQAFDQRGGCGGVVADFLRNIGHPPCCLR